MNRKATQHWNITFIDQFCKIKTERSWNSTRHSHEKEASYCEASKVFDYSSRQILFQLNTRDCTLNKHFMQQHQFTHSATIHVNVTRKSLRRLNEELWTPCADNPPPPASRIPTGHYNTLFTVRYSWKTKCDREIRWSRMFLPSFPAIWREQVTVH